MLRQWVREGQAPPGAPLVVGEIAAHLQVSATPVREALSRLAGEGLIEDRRGHGYFVHRLEVGLLQHVLGLHRILVVGAIREIPSTRRGSMATPLRGAEDSDEGVAFRRATEEVFTHAVRAVRNSVLSAGYRTNVDRLAFVRRVEPVVLAGLWPELQGLAFAMTSGDEAAVLWTLDQYHIRRINAAADLVAAARDFGDKNSADIV